MTPTPEGAAGSGCLVRQLRSDPLTRSVLTVEETAELLRIGRSAAYAGVRAGEIPSIKVGRSIRVPRHLLERLLGLHNDFEPAGDGPEVKTHAEGGGGDVPSG